MGLFALNQRSSKCGAGLLGVALAVALAVAAAAQATDDPAAPARVEARSASFLAVGIVRGEAMSIHLSRLLDNAPVHDAVVSVTLRGAVYPTTALTDGSYGLREPALGLPGSASIEFEVKQGVLDEHLDGTLQVAAATGKAPGQSQARQYWWWALNFGVCIGFLMLISRRRKAQT
jgi:hypothetical protein